MSCPRAPPHAHWQALTALQRNGDVGIVGAAEQEAAVRTKLAVALSGLASPTRETVALLLLTSMKEMLAVLTAADLVVVLDTQAGSPPGSEFARAFCMGYRGEKTPTDDCIAEELPTTPGSGYSTGLRGWTGDADFKIYWVGTKASEPSFLAWHEVIHKITAPAGLSGILPSAGRASQYRVLDNCLSCSHTGDGTVSRCYYHCATPAVFTLSLPS